MADGRKFHKIGTQNLMQKARATVTILVGVTVSIAYSLTTEESKQVDINLCVGVGKMAAGVV